MGERDKGTHKGCPYGGVWGSMLVLESVIRWEQSCAWG